MKTRNLLAVALIAFGILTLGACGMIAPSACSTGNCVVKVTGTNQEGMPVFQATRAPKYPPYPAAPVAAEKQCDSLDGDWYQTNPDNSFAIYSGGKWHGVYVCENIPYIGNDGGSYYFGNIDITYGHLVITNPAVAPSATQPECQSGNYPAGDPGTPGIWNSAYHFCQPGS